LTAGALALAAAPAVAGTPATSKPRRLKVEVADDFFGPAKSVVKPRTKVTWRWTDRSAGVHDVKLVKAPKGVRRFASEPGTAGYAISRWLTKPGTYRFVCTFHISVGMQMRITVRR
jgi:plastocyanin